MPKIRDCFFIHNSLDTTYIGTGLQPRNEVVVLHFIQVYGIPYIYY